MIRLAVAMVCLAALARGQELLWTVHTNAVIQHTECMRWFGDYDGDGAEDLLVRGVEEPGFFIRRLRVLSGINGAVLTELSFGGVDWHVSGAGDWDQDGYPDVVLRQGLSLEVWSFAKQARLAVMPGASTWGSYNGDLLGSVDLDGDGLRDVVYAQMDGRIDALDHYGGLLYSIPALALGYLVNSLAGVGDLDGDACDDFIFGAWEGISGAGYGAVVLVSGKTGTILRNHFGSYPGAGINKDVRAAGDVDGDGVMDFAGGNLSAPSGLVMIWSGATGAVIRQWVVPVMQLGGFFLAGHDVDLDGRPDIIGIAQSYQNVPGQLTSWRGRVRSLSSRDGQDLVHVANEQACIEWGHDFADLGVQPGNPYPVFVLMDQPGSPMPLPNWPRIRAFRLSPAGTRFIGAGCASSGAVPTIGIRRIDGSPTDGSRLVLGSAPPNAFAVLVASPTSTVLPAPIALDFLGLPGCSLLVPPVILELRATGAAGMDRGYAAFDFPSPMVATGGVEFAAQWVVLDPATLQFATSARYEFRVQ